MLRPNNRARLAEASIGKPILGPRLVVHARDAKDGEITLVCLAADEGQQTFWVYSE